MGVAFLASLDCKPGPFAPRGGYENREPESVVNTCFMSNLRFSIKGRRAKDYEAYICMHAMDERGSTIVNRMQSHSITAWIINLAHATQVRMTGKGYGRTFGLSRGVSSCIALKEVFPKQRHGLSHLVCRYVATICTQECLSFSQMCRLFLLRLPSVLTLLP